MPVDVSVVVRTGNGLPRRLVSSVDTQTLLVDAYELVVVDAGLSTGARSAVDRLAARRINVRVTDDSNLPNELSGRYLLPVSPDQHLYPDALRRLLDFANLHDLDAVAGRLVGPNLWPGSNFLADTPGVSAADVHQTLSASLCLLRAEAGSLEDGHPTAKDASAAGVLTSYPAGFGPARGAVSAATVRVSGTPVVGWRGSQVEIDLEGTVAGSPADDVQPVLLIRQGGTNLTYLLPTDGEVTPGEEGSSQRTWHLTSRFSPLTAAVGGPLPPGPWELSVALSEPDRPSRTVGVPAAPLSAGLFDELVIVPAPSARRTLYFDIGPTRASVIGTAGAADASVSESARGSELRLALPNLNVQTTSPVSGSLAVGRLHLPARIEVTDGSAVLSAFVSGIAGRYPLSTQFGGTAWHPLGLSLDISGVGTMAVVSTTVEKPAPTISTTRPTKRAVKRAAKGPIARLRRAVPRSWEPQVRRIRRHPMARSIYRRLTGLGR